MMRVQVGRRQELASTPAGSAAANAARRSLNGAGFAAREFVLWREKPHASNADFSGHS